MSTDITEKRVAAFLQSDPDFFVRHPNLLADLNIPHGQSGKSVSLIERQTLVLRERVKALESRMASLVHNAQDNRRLDDQLMLWVRGLLQSSEAVHRADGMARGLSKIFAVPSVALAIWEAGRPGDIHPWRVSKTDAAVALADDLLRPICLPANAHQAQVAIRILSPADQDATSGGSVAILPLRVGASPLSFGLLVFGASDASRFSPDVGIEFLERLAELTSASLQSLAAPRPLGA